MRDVPLSPYTNINYFKSLCLTLFIISSVVVSPKFVDATDSSPQSHNEVLGIKIVNAIKQIETRGRCDRKGLSGERGCFQFLISTFRNYQKTYLGTTTLPLTPQNEQLVMETKVRQMLEKGFTPSQIFLEHNTGRTGGGCTKGINKYGVPYDSCTYVKSLLSLI